MSDDPIAGFIKRGLAEAVARALDDAPDPQPMSDDRDIRLVATKSGYTLPMSYDMAVEHGLISEEDARAQGWTPHEYPPIPFRRRVRYRLHGWWSMRPRAHFGPCRHENCG